MVGVWAYQEKTRFSSTSIESVYDILFDMSLVLMVVGVVVFVVTFTGCVGALRENLCLLNVVSIPLRGVPPGFHHLRWLPRAISSPYLLSGFQAEL